LECANETSHSNYLLAAGLTAVTRVVLAMALAHGLVGDGVTATIT